MKLRSHVRLSPKTAHQRSWTGLKTSKKCCTVRAPDRSRPPRKDGSGRCAPRPSTRPSASRSGPPPRTCSASTRGSSGRRGAGCGKGSAGNRGSTEEVASSSGQLGEPERSQRSLRLQVGERHLERRRAGDQDHVISYSHLAQGRIRFDQPASRHLAQAPPGAVALDRGLDPPADGHADAAFHRGAGNGKSDQGAAAVEPLAADRRLKVRTPTETEPSFQLDPLRREPWARPAV